MVVETSITSVSSVRTITRVGKEEKEGFKYWKLLQETMTKKLLTRRGQFLSTLVAKFVAGGSVVAIFAMGVWFLGWLSTQPVLTITPSAAEVGFWIIVGYLAFFGWAFLLMKILFYYGGISEVLETKFKKEYDAWLEPLED